MSDKPFDLLRSRRAHLRAAVLLGAVLLALALAVAASSSRRASAAGPARGGTLRLLGQSDIFNLDTTSGYYTVVFLLYRAFARQLLTYPNAASFQDQIRLAPDIAAAVPTRGNGGVSADGRTYTLHLRKGVMWDTSPPRQVTAGDFVREFKLLCNPASPTGAPGYYTSTIVGMKAYCDGFSKVKATVPAIAKYVAAHRLAGVVARGDLTVAFHLTGPAPDFLNILAMPFSSARPVEYMQYVPDSAQQRQHTISNGPYRITKYVPGKEFDLERNPAWNPKTDPLRHAYVDGMKVTEGLTADSVQQQLEAGTADLAWDVQVPPQDLPRLISANDKRLVIGPTGPYYVALNVYLDLNQYAGPFKNKLVREAANYAVDKLAIVQIEGGPRVAAATNQVVLPGNVGYIEGFNPYPNNNGRGDPAKAKQLLAKAGYPNGVDVKLVYQTNDPTPRIAQSLQASMSRAGFRVKLVPVTQADFYGKYMLDPKTAQRDVWDLSTPGWIPDWFGNNGRSVIQPLFSDPAPGSSDYSGYSSPVTDRLIDRALTAPSAAAATGAWTAANRQLMKDAATVPVEIQKWPIFHSSRVQNCKFWVLDLNCDPTNVWLQG
jgi:ABC-type transport system substrate-binding protein